MKSGDLCQKCGKALMGAVSSRAAGDYQIRYLKCPRCGSSCRSVVKAETIRRRGICGKMPV